MCHLGVNQLITVYHFSLLCEMDESTSIRFRIPKTSDEEKTSIINSVPKSTVSKNKWAIQIFFENQWTFGYCIQISKDLDTISKSLKILIQFFIGYPNTCT